jgi:CRISPR/Cas system-associated exonuclease Cas4 (RecB family)
MTTIITPMAHSHSRLNVFTQCPLAYKLQYIDKVSPESSDALEIGAAAHEFFEMWVKDKEVRDAGLATDSLENAVQVMAAFAFQKEPRDQSNFKDYLEICRTFAKAYKPDPAYPVVIAERQVAIGRDWKECGWFDPGVMFRAKIDRIEQPAAATYAEVKKIRITDYKTGFAGSLDSFQLDVYALIASILYPALEQVEVEFYYVKSGFKQVKLLNVDDMGITKVQLEALMERIESEAKWKAKPGQKCLNCSVAAHCTQKASDLKAIDSLEVAKSFAEEIAFLDAQKKAKTKALKTFCQQSGAVEAGGLKYDHYPTESLVIEMAPFLSACISFNVDPGEILNPDSKKLKKAMKQTPGFAEAIAPYTGVDVSMRFMGKKASGDDE